MSSRTLRREVAKDVTEERFRSLYVRRLQHQHRSPGGRHIIAQRFSAYFETRIATRVVEQLRTATTNLAAKRRRGVRPGRQPGAK